jgi:hypothetical protein
MLTGLASGPIRWYAALVAIIAYTGTELDANRRFRAVYAEFGDALSADVIISIVLIVAGILVTLRR